MSNYDKPYRGLPTEVRLMIWQSMVPSTVKMHLNHRSPIAEDGMLKPSLKPTAASDMHYLKLLQVNSEVRMEVFEVMRSNIIFNCRGCMPQDLIPWLSSLPDHIRTMMKGVQINFDFDSYKGVSHWEPQHLYSLAKLPWISTLEWVVEMWDAATADIFELPDEKRSMTTLWEQSPFGCILHDCGFPMWYIIWAVKNHLSSMTVIIDNLQTNSVGMFLRDITETDDDPHGVSEACARSRWKDFQAQHGVRVDITNNEEYKKSDERNQLTFVVERVVVNH